MMMYMLVLFHRDQNTHVILFLSPRFRFVCGRFFPPKILKTKKSITLHPFLLMSPFVSPKRP